MLIINRHPGAKIIIETPSGEIIKITALGFDDNGLNIGFDADKSIKIDREEKFIHDNKDTFGNR